MNDKHADLAQLQKKTTRSDRLLIRVSHDIRTAVNSILGLTELLRESHLSPNQRYHVSVARASADHLLQESTEIIDLARAELGSLQLRPVSFQLHDTLRQAVELMSVLAGYKGITLRIDIARGVPAAVIGDPERLSQILITLVRTGIDRMSAGEIAISVQPGAGASPANMIEFRVIDAGRAIPAADLDRVFDDALDGETATGNVFGLPLAFASRLAGMMGGSMWAENQAGPGVAFHFSANLPGAEGFASANTPDSSKWNKPVETRALKILVAEDTVDNLLLIRAFLKDEPWEIDSAENGRIAVEKALAASYNLILMDIDMPEMDGHTATRQIRVAECRNETLSVPIVALTAHNEAEAAFQSIEAGCTAHVTKPIRKAALIETIRHYAQESGASARLPA